jgi:hypothetical protein
MVEVDFEEEWWDAIVVKCIACPKREAGGAALPGGTPGFGTPGDAVAPAGGAGGATTPSQEAWPKRLLLTDSPATHIAGAAPGAGAPGGGATEGGATEGGATEGGTDLEAAGGKGGGEGAALPDGAAKAEDPAGTGGEARRWPASQPPANASEGAPAVKAEDPAPEPSAGDAPAAAPQSPGLGAAGGAGAGGTPGGAGTPGQAPGSARKAPAPVTQEDKDMLLPYMKEVCACFRPCWRRFVFPQLLAVIVRARCR